MARVMPEHIITADIAMVATPAVQRALHVATEDKQLNLSKGPAVSQLIRQPHHIAEAVPEAAAVAEVAAAADQQDLN